jgi:hypothetical protein
MEIPRNKTGREFLKSFANILKNQKTGFDYFCNIWFLAKYGEPHILINVIINKDNIWKNEQFLARQVVSVLPRLVNFKEQFVIKLLQDQIAMGPRDAASVATNLNLLFQAESIPYLSQYLFPPKPQHPFPLPKFLILTALLSSKKLKPADRQRISTKIKTHISDPWYLYWLRKDKLI